jgi:quercetin dioxygenase-like cupin family protein
VNSVTPSFPKVITDLPEADIPFEGFKAWIAQGSDHQIVFFEIEPSREVSEHSHPYIQWGIVVDGEMELTIDGNTHVYRKGDDYSIPAHAKHSAKFLAASKVIDFFREPTRFNHKKR